MSWGEGSMSWAELRDLVQALPEDSATKAAAAGGGQEEQRWTHGMFLQAATYNVLLMIMRVLWVGQQLKGQPPDMQAISPPSFGDDTGEDEAAVAISEHLLNQYSPATPQSDPEEIAEWEQAIRQLEAHGA